LGKQRKGTALSGAHPDAVSRSKKNKQREAVQGFDTSARAAGGVREGQETAWFPTFKGIT
jgi:hypothetical protein